MEPLILTRIDGPIARLILNRPDRLNALDEPLADAFVAAVEALRDHPEVRVLVISGAGRSFCSGGDLSMLDGFTRLTLEQGAERMHSFYSRYLKLRDVPVPVIAAVHGSAMGAGACLALACDLRVARADARIGFNFLKLGLHPGLGATELLPHVVGEARATELLMTGRSLTGLEAEAIGLVHRSAPPERFEAAVTELALELAGTGPLAARLLKERLRARIDPVRLEAALRFEALAQARCYQTADFREGIAAAKEKRAPLFQDG
jgi:enoyl-CoA hydratase